MVDVLRVVVVELRRRDGAVVWVGEPAMVGAVLDVPVWVPPVWVSDALDALCEDELAPQPPTPSASSRNSTAGQRRSRIGPYRNEETARGDVAGTGAAEIDRDSSSTVW